MKTHLSCIPCFFKQMLQAGETAGLSKPAIKRLMDTLGRELSDFSLSDIPPHVGKRIQELLAAESGDSDPYAQIKRTSNQRALSVYPELKQMAFRSSDPLYTAVQLACAGNIIDYGIFAGRDIDVSKEIQNILDMERDIIERERPDLFAYHEFRDSLQRISTLVYAGDNAGEIVFDRVLIETIAELYPSVKIYFAVRSKPIINDCLEEDAYACGLHHSAEIISSGAASPGLLVDDATEACRKLLSSADMIISKGQGNYEALSLQQLPIFFLLIAKCQVIADDIGCEVGDLVLKQHRYGSFDS